MFPRSGTLCAAVVLAGACDLHAGTLHVPSEYPTIQAGLDAAAAGDTVRVAPGTYSTVTTRVYVTAVGFIPVGVTLQSESGPALTEIAPPAGANAIYCSQVAAGSVSVSGFTFRAADRTPITLYGCDGLVVQDCVFIDTFGGINTYQASLTVRDSRFESCRTPMVLWNAAVRVVGDASLVVESCDFFDNALRAVQVSAPGTLPATTSIVGSRFYRNESASTGSAVSLSNVQDVEVRDCEFVDNLGPGTLSASAISPSTMHIEDCLFVGNDVGSSADPPSVLVWGSYGGRLSGNTFWNNRVVESRASVVALVTPPGTVLDVESNVFAGSRGGFALGHYGTGTVQSACNLFWDNADGNWPPGFYTPGADEQFSDPLFCAPVSGDFSVASGSACLPAGNPCGVRIGARGEGCVSVAIQPSTWAGIKARYRVPAR